MSRLDEVSPTRAGSEKVLVDLPLRGVEFGDPPLPLAAAMRVSGEASASIAGLARRAGAFAADMAAILLVWAAAVLGAGALRGEIPGAAGLAWAAAFVLLLSFFATVPALLLFGKTVGMAVAGLAVAPAATGHRLAIGQAALRWAGTLVTAATLGAPLLLTIGASGKRTPADWLSGRALVDENVSRLEGIG